MARTPEGKVKDKIVRILKEFNAFYFFPSTGGYGASGVPDIIACYEGHFLAIEAKAGKNTPTALQRQKIEMIRGAGGFAMVVNEQNIDDVKKVLHAFETYDACGLELFGLANGWTK